MTIIVCNASMPKLSTYLWGVSLIWIHQDDSPGTTVVLCMQQITWYIILLWDRDDIYKHTTYCYFMDVVNITDFLSWVQRQSIEVILGSCDFYWYSYNLHPKYFNS